MIEVDNKQINVSVWTVLNILRDQLHNQGIFKLKDIKKKGDNIRINCPSHKNGQEDHPSCSVLTVEKTIERNGKTEILPAGFVSCFTCGYRASLPQAIGDLFNQDKEFGSNWLLTQFDYNFIETNLYLNLPLEYNYKEPESNREYIDEEILQELRTYHPYMWKRKLTPEIVEKFDIGYNPYTNSITFPVCDNKGCLFLVQRNVDVKFFMMPEDITKEIFGMNHITSDMHTIWICESVLNCLICWKYGIPAVALLGTGTAAQIEVLKNHPTINRYVLALDPDTAGKKGTARIKKELKQTKLVYEVKYQDWRDLNDLDNEILNLEIIS